MAIDPTASSFSAAHRGEGDDKQNGSFPGKNEEAPQYAAESFNSDRVSFGTIFILALYGAVSSFLMPLGQLQEPGPGFFPLALSTILLVLSGLGIFSARPSSEDLARSEPFWGDMKTPMKIVLATGLAIFAFEPVGFLITSSCFLVLLFLWVSLYPWWKAVVFGIAGGVSGWFCFVRLLGVPMPGGILG
jgi:hypothetical protein